MIKIQVIGHLGKDALTNVVSGKNVINFSVAHTESWKDSKGEKRDKTTWVECAFWTERTAIAPYLLKGTQVFVEGIPEVREYETKDGRKGTSLVCRVMNVQLLSGSRKQGDGQSTNTEQQQPESGFKPMEQTAPTDAEAAAVAQGGLPF